MYADTLGLTPRWTYVYLQQNLLGCFMYLNNGNVINDKNMSFSEQCFVNIIQPAQPVNRSLKNKYLNYSFIVASLCSLV